MLPESITSASARTNSTHEVASRTTRAGCISSPRCCAAVLPQKRRARSLAAITCAFFAPRSVEGTHALCRHRVASARFANILDSCGALAGGAVDVASAAQDALPTRLSRSPRLRHLEAGAALHLTHQRADVVVGRALK